MITDINILTDTDIENIHQCTLDILSKVGVVFQSADALDIFEKHGAKIDRQKVLFPPDLIEKSLKIVPASFSLYGRNPQNNVEIGRDTTICAPGCGAISILDNKSGLRKPTSEDYLSFVKLVQQSSFLKVNGDGIVYPSDIPDQLFHRYVLYTTLNYSDKPLMGLTIGKKVSKECIEMAEIGFGGLKENIILGMANMNTPLLYDSESAEGIIEYARWKQPIGIACCGMAGSTAPVTLAGMLAVNNAEVLAGIILAQLVNPGNPVIYGNTSSIANMKSISLSLGAPETSIIISASAQLAKYYKIPFRSGGALTTARSNSIQAGYESMMSLYTAFLSGSHFILHATGLLDSLMTISYEKFIMDEEIGLMITRFMKGFLVNAQTLAFDTIAERGPGGHFLDTPHTLNHFRSEHWQPVVFDQLPKITSEADKKDINDVALGICAKRLSEYVKPHLDERIDRRLNEYFRATR